MKKVALDFPGAILVFATLKGELSNIEKRLLRPLVNDARRLYLAGNAYNPVLILTSHELYAHWSLHHSWEKASPKHKEFTRGPNPDYDVLELCNSTHQLYLNMISQSDWIRNIIEEKNQKRSRSKNIKRG